MGSRPIPHRNTSHEVQIVALYDLVRLVRRRGSAAHGTEQMVVMLGLFDDCMLTKKLG